MKRGLFASAALLLVALATPARAQSPQEIALARQTAIEGLTAYKAGDYEKALRLFEQAKAVYPSGNVLRLLGYTHLAQNRWEKCVEEIESALATKVGPLAEDDKKDARENLDKCLAHFGTLVVTSKVDGTKLKIDNTAPVELPLAKPVRLLEGKHTLTATAADHLDVSDEIEILGGKSADVTLTPSEKEKPPPPPPPPSPPPPPPPPPKKGLFPHQRTIGIAAAGVGVGLGATALITALAGAHLRSNVASDVDAHNAFYGDGCAKGDKRLCQFDISVINHDADRADALRNASVWMGIGAGVLVAGGATLFVLAPKEEKKTADEAPTSARRAPSAACSLSGATFVTCAGSF
jgi:hypothetical protein